MSFRLTDLSNDQMDAYLKSYPNYGGSHSCRRLPKIENKVYVVNMDINPKGEGTHWTVVSNLDSNKVIYFDPFGLPPNTYTDKWARSSNKPLFYSNADYQNLDSHACGYYCTEIAKELLQGKSMENAIKVFTNNTIKNERTLEHIFIL